MSIIQMNKVTQLLHTDHGKTKIVACATVIEELLPLLPPQMHYETLDFDLHFNAHALKNVLQNAINMSPKGIKYIVLGYGLCSQAVVGLKAESCSLVIPRVDDCIALFLGSQKDYKQQFRKIPGTYYLTESWMDKAHTPFDEYSILVDRYGEEKALSLIGQILNNFKRLAWIHIADRRSDINCHRARTIAERFGLYYEELEGSRRLLKKMVYGPWDNDFIVSAPGRPISFLDFKPSDSALPLS